MGSGWIEQTLRPSKEPPLHSLPKTNPKLNRLAGIALVLAALVVGVLLRRPAKSLEPVLEPGQAIGAVEATAGSLAILAPDAGEISEPGSMGRTPLHELRPRELASSEAASKKRSKWDFGVVGYVRQDPSEKGFTSRRMSGGIRAVDSKGDEHSERLEFDGEFNLYGLHPGWWVVEFETGRTGHGSTRVLLTDEAPVATIDFGLVSPPSLDIEISIKPDFPASEAKALNRRRNLFVAVHEGPDSGPETSWESLDVMASGKGTLLWRGAGLALETEVFMVLPSDRELNLSLFMEDRWIARRVKAEGERSIRWDVGADEFTMALGRLEIELVDARNGKPLDYPIQTPHWAADRGVSMGVGKATFLDVPPGWRTLFIQADDHESREHKVYVGPGEVVQKTIQLHPGVRIAGEVVTSEGDPVQTYMAAWLVDAISGKPPSSPTRVIWTSHHGEFAFSCMPPGTYMIRDLKPGEHGIESGANYPSFGSSLIRVEASIDREGLVVELEPLGSLVIELGQEPQGPVSWKLIDQSGHPMRRGQLKSLAPLRIALPVGTYQLESETAAGVRDTRTLKVGGGEQRVAL